LEGIGGAAHTPRSEIARDRHRSAGREAYSTRYHLSMMNRTRAGPGGVSEIHIASRVGLFGVKDLIVPESTTFESIDRSHGDESCGLCACSDKPISRRDL
jgi:hypothetical protein